MVAVVGAMFTGGLKNVLACSLGGADIASGVYVAYIKGCGSGEESGKEGGEREDEVSDVLHGNNGGWIWKLGGI